MDTLLDRFCRYVKVETTAAEDAKTYPSTPGQLDLGRMLADELRALKLDAVSMDENGIVMATVPGNVPGAPTIAWCSHMDTSPEFTAKNVKPIVHRNYDGKDITLPGDPSRVIKVSESDGLAALKGKTLITSDGTTLLGADDKAGLAAIMTAAAHLIAHPELKHGPIRIVFTCDEEVGHGTDKLDLKKIAAQVAYTLDGEAEAQIENETWSANLAVVTITGKNIHPGFAKGRMVNAIRLAAAFIERMPWQTLAPETTEGRVGFLHPYVIEGGVPEVKLRVLLRSFVTKELADQENILRNVAATLMAEFPGAKIDIAVTEQYRNMLEYLAKDPRAVKLAEQAVRNAGLTPKFQSIRGGTDGSKLSEKGLPTPNLSVGMHNFHSPLEFACLEQMESAVKVLVELAQLWGKEK
ncbi:MAG TPA: peptidase T [Phycisphaerae bacterium]|nr:peptidase T [Phycisphaerae bacterium]